MAAGRRVDADLAFVALEAKGEPFLRLAAEFSLQADADEGFILDYPGLAERI